MSILTFTLYYAHSKVIHETVQCIYQNEYLSCILLCTYKSCVYHIFIALLISTDSPLIAASWRGVD